jgi:hypothetical protein
MSRAALRVRVQSRAEVEIARYKGDHAAWHKHVHNVDLDPMQVLKMIQMDEHPNTVDFSCRRTGKTAVKEMHALEFLACNPHQEEGIVAPRVQQSQTNLDYHLDAIRRSDILRAYVAWKSGREQLTDTRYQLANGSKGIAYGIMSQIDGDALSIASIEEVDDMPMDRLKSRFLPMLGSARRLGVSRTVKFEPQIRVTGVFKGADVLTSMIDSGRYHLLPPVNVHLGIELGILNAAYMEEMRSQLPEAEYIRQFLCVRVQAQNWIWEKYIKRAMSVAIAARLEPAMPMPGVRYRRRGLIGFGYDHLGHGETPASSRSALVVAEQLGGFLTFPYVRSWPAGTDESVIRRDLVSAWEYFRPDYAIGDAYGIGMLTVLNDDLHRAGLTDIDRQTIGDGQSTASTWWQWAFAPMRFDGMTKHSMASQLRAVFHNGQAAIPYVDTGMEARASSETAGKWQSERAHITQDYADWLGFVRQLGNVRSEATKQSYASYKMAEPKLGDDFFDAACAAVWALATRGEGYVPTLIETRRQTIEQLVDRALVTQ